MTLAVEALVAAAKAAGATVVESAGAVVLVVPTARTADPTELLPLVEAARVAATSVRVVRDAIRSGVLPAVGKQRDRAVRRGELEAWIESRRAPVVKVTDEQEQRIEARLRRKRRSKPGAGSAACAM
jgi:hypothetical protein